MPLKIRPKLALSLVILTLLSCASVRWSNANQPQNLSAIPWITPLPWNVIQRVASPDNKVDAVLVTRPDSEPPFDKENEADPTDLYIVPHQADVPREPPYPPDVIKARAHTERIRAETPFHAYGVEGVAAEWKDNQTLRIRARKATVHDCDPTKEVSIEGKKRLVYIEYRFNEGEKVTL